jgi:A/G-specific adenine glycosylase
MLVPTLKRSPASPRRSPGFDVRAGLQLELARWFQGERRDLPWRRTRDPYAIWISEAMLQQTRVAAVIPHYERFLARFPDVAALARAEEDEVLASWSGLGYYTRARSLRRAARAIVLEHGGEFPRTRAAWLALPGVGPYTAGAVLSIAFSASEPLVDGNVQRVFARLFALEEPQGSKALSERCWALARELVPPVPRPGAAAALDPGDWNQALMELGARVCTPRAPACDLCPLRGRCRAFALGRVQELPRPRARRAQVDVRLEILVASSQDRLLCVRRPEEGRMAGLFEFPTRELVAGGAEPRLWPSAGLRGLTRVAGEPLGELVHTITHHRVRAEVYAGRVAGRRLPAVARWGEPDELAALALTGLARKVLALVRGRAPSTSGSAR